MIMAGRGKRLGQLGNQTKKVGSEPTTPTTENCDLPTIVKKINEIDTTGNDLSDFSNIQNSFKQLCTSKEVMKDILSDFHEKALSDSKFGKKFLLALGPIFNLQINEVLVRSEFLTLLQNDFGVKDSVSQTDRKKFLNGVELLGNFYNTITLHKAPIKILSIALLEYLNMLLGGEEEDMKVLTNQIFLNGLQLSTGDKESETFSLFQHKLRDTLLKKDISNKSKQWILLSIDFISNSFKPLTGAVHDYYTKNLGEDYKVLQAAAQLNKTTPSLNNSFSSPESTKSQESSSPKHKNFEPRKDLSEKFTNMSVSKSDEGKEKFKGQRRDNQKFQNRDKPRSSKGYSSSGHDDRFEKDEDFYGKQLPRRPKPENPNKSFD